MTEIAAPGSPPAQVRFHFIKSKLFRAIHVDGAMGGVTPRGLIHCAVYSERQAIPQTIDQEIKPDGVLGEVRAQSGREGIVREIDVDLFLTKQTAKELSDWLRDRVADLDRLEKEASARQGHHAS